MSVKINAPTCIYLVGDSSVEEAEVLLQALSAHPNLPLDWQGCTHLHTAVLQVVLAASPALIGPCGDSWVERWVEPQLSEPHGALSHPPL